MVHFDCVPLSTFSAIFQTRVWESRVVLFKVVSAVEIAQPFVNVTCLDIYVVPVHAPGLLSFWVVQKTWWWTNDCTRSAKLIMASKQTWCIAACKLPKCDIWQDIWERVCVCVYVCEKESERLTEARYFLTVCHIRLVRHNKVDLQQHYCVRISSSASIHPDMWNKMC